MSRLAAPLVVALAFALVLSACDGSPEGDPDSPRGGAAPALSGSWEPAPDAPFPGSLAGRVGVPASDEVVVSITLRNARFTAIPEACTPSTVVRRKSRIADGNARLLCSLEDSTSDRTIEFAAVAAGAEGDEMGGTIRNEADDTEIDLPALVIDEGPASLSPRLRLLSSPDVLNGAYRATLDAVLDDWEAADPDGVLIAGALTPQYLDPFARHDLSVVGGRPRLTDRLAPDVQLITIDPFELAPGRLRGVLRDAQRDQVRWIIVQGQLPILGPVRTRASSDRYLTGGADSQVWRLFEKYGVDLYLAGEAHDVTVLEVGGVTQITHGGPIALGLTTALLLDFYDDYIYVTLRDYDRRETPYTVGTGVVRDTGGLQLETGMLRPGL